MENLKDYILESKKSVLETYYGIKSNEYSPRPINEASINRILSKHTDSGFIIVSANRSDLDKKTNKENAKKCIDMIKASGYSYFPVYGGYKGTDGVTDNYELSFFVTNYKGKEKQDDFEPLKELAIKICKAFNQDSVLVVEPKGTPQYIDRNGKVVGKQASDHTSINDLSKEFFTAISKKKSGTKRMSYDMEFECFVNPKPCTVNERMRRVANGEIIID